MGRYNIASRLGLTVEYKRFDSRREMIRAACDGKLDLLMNLSITAERTECLVFTRDYIQVPIAIVARTADQRVISSRTLKDLRVATERDFATRDAVRLRYPEALHTDVGTTREALRAVSDDRADVYIGNAYVVAELMQTQDLYGIRMVRISDLPPYYLHFAVPHANRPLADAINAAMQQMRPARKEAIDLKWLPVLSWMNVPDAILEPRHKAALSAPLRLAFPPRFSPISYRNADGTPAGLVSEYLQHFEDLGAKFEPLQLNTWREARDAMRNGRVDIALVMADPANAQHDWVESLPIISIPNVIVIAGDSKESYITLRDMSNATIAVSDPERLIPLISKSTKGIHFLRADNPEHGLALVRSHEATAYVGNLAVVDALLRDHFAGYLRVSGPAGIDDTFVLAAPRENSMVIEAFDRMLLSMSPREREAIRGDWLSFEYDSGPDWRRIFTWLAIAASVVVTIFLIQRRAYRKLRAEISQRRLLEIRFKEVTNNLPAVVYQAAVDASGEVSFPFIIGDLKPLFGVSADQVMHNGKLLLERIDPCDRKRVGDAIRNSSLGNGNIDGDFRALSEHGWRWIHANSLQYRTNANQRHWTGYWVDVTEKHRQWEDLMEAKAFAEQALKAKTRFLAMMSHEIRTPMSGVIGLLEVLSHTSLDQEQHRIVGTIGDSAQVLRQILDDILDYSKMEAGGLTLDAQPLDLRNSVSCVVQMLAPLASQRQLSIKTSFDSKIAPLLVGDELRIRQILFNLLSNAIKFTRQGGVEVAVILADESANAQQISMVVRDSGIGISVENQGRLFQPFTQAEASTARGYGGTGLGLSICKHIVTLMQGSISLQSELGVGTTVQVLLWLERAAESEQGGISAAHSPPALIARPKKARVLAAEDHPTNQTLIAWYMQQLQMDYRIVTNGVEALEAMEESQFDLLLTDCLMPEMDGYELSRHIRERERISGGKRMPIIAITASVYGDEVDRCHASGMDECVAKPLSLQTLARTLAAHLGEEGGDESPKNPSQNPHAGAAVFQRVATKYGATAMAEEMLRAFRESTVEDMRQLRTCWVNDGPGAKRLLHRMAGGLLAIDEAGLAQQATNLERPPGGLQHQQELESFLRNIESLISVIDEGLSR